MNRMLQRPLDFLLDSCLRTAVRLQRDEGPSLDASTLATVRRIRGLDYSGCSDLELKEALGRWARADAGPGKDAISEVFAIVDEAISRRLGAWRLFDEDFDKRGLGRFDGLAKDEMRLDADERSIVRTMDYVSEKRQDAYPSDVMLPADFYRSLSAKDVDGAVAFRATDEQLAAGLLMCGKRVVEMDAGEGKTIAAAFPAVLQALRGRSVHIITSNDYLAGRDAEWLAPVYESLGLTVGAVLGYMEDDERRHAYRQQIVYGTLREFGFDFLRDNLKHPPSEPVQKALDVAIVDEADHVLIDQALTPMIIAGDPAGNGRAFEKTGRAVAALVSDQAAAVLELERQAGDAASDRRAQDVALARLSLADPDNRRLTTLLAADSDTRSRVRGLVRNDEYSDQADKLSRDLMYWVDASPSSVTLTERGQASLEGHLGPIFDTTMIAQQLVSLETESDLPLEERRRLGDRIERRIHRQYRQMNQANQMLRAYVLLKRDVDYAVMDGDVVLIDELTGRTLPENRYQYGLHAALEAKEGVSVHPEAETLAQISVPGMIQRYSHVSGMTGTALDSRDELQRTYGLRVTRVRPHRPSMRTDLGARVYVTTQDKLDAVLDEVNFAQRVGRPVLVGTLTIERSEEVSRLLDEQGVTHTLLNAVNSSDEAKVVRDAGSLGAVTIATNMAGRGTDIVLDADLEERVIDGYVVLATELLSAGATCVELACASIREADAFQTALSRLHDLVVQRDRATIRLSSASVRGPGRTVRLEAGLGLYVIGTEMNRSGRIDSQLRGRSGRQGAFGASRFVLSLEDRLLAHKGHNTHARAGAPRSDSSGRAYYEGPRLERYLASVQDNVAGDDEVSRIVTCEYDRVVEAQAFAYYRTRRRIIEADGLQQADHRFASDWAVRLVERHFPGLRFRDYESQFCALADELLLDFDIDCYELMGERLDGLAPGLEGILTGELERARATLGESAFSYLEKTLFLQTSDELWREQMVHLQGLKQSVTASSHAHKSAVANYAIGSFAAYEAFGPRVIDSFLQRLATFPADEAPEERQEAEVSLTDDVSLILV